MIFLPVSSNFIIYRCEQSYTLSYTQFLIAAVKYNYLPSLIECDDTEFDEMLNDIDMIERTKPVTKKESNALSKNTFNFFCKSISIALDSRLDVGLELHVETQLRRLTNRTSLISIHRFLRC